VFGRCVNVNEALYLSTFSRAGGMMMGAAFAMVWRPVAIMRGPLRKRGRRVDVVALVGMAGLWLLMTRVELFNEFTAQYDSQLFRGGFLLTGLCTIAIIAAATHRRSWLGRLLGIRPLNWVGTRSYGLYLYHWPIYQIIRTPGEPLSWSQFAIAMLITLPVTELSYRLIEVPIRTGRVGEWMRGQRPARTKVAVQRRRRTFVVVSLFAVLAGFATVTIATADVLCDNQVACDSERGLDARSGGSDARSHHGTAHHAAHAGRHPQRARSRPRRHRRPPPRSALSTSSPPTPSASRSCSAPRRSSRPAACR
jgi:hypothetical protein